MQGELPINADRSDTCTLFEQAVDVDAVTLKARLTRLQDPATYPDRPAMVMPVETSLSWVFLTDRYAYKLKKPICHPLIDLSTLAAREDDAKAEITLNRHLAPKVYLDTIALTQAPSGQLRLGGQGEVVDWLVKMRRLPDRLMLDSLIRRQALPRARLRALADRLARFYVETPRVNLSGLSYRERLWVELLVNHAVLTAPASALPVRRIERLHARLFSFLERHQALFDARAEGGYLAAGHGDLRPEHVCLLGRPVVFDCLEFSERLRQLDPLDDLAFLTVGCERLGCSRVGEMLYEVCRGRSGDSAPNRLVEFYCSFRASMRARLAAAHLPSVPTHARKVWLGNVHSFLSIAERHASALE
jgi:aminoglycoside phosphotransferase family enzyme